MFSLSYLAEKNQGIASKAGSEESSEKVEAGSSKSSEDTEFRNGETPPASQVSRTDSQIRSNGIAFFVFDLDIQQQVLFIEGNVRDNSSKKRTNKELPPLPPVPRTDLQIQSEGILFFVCALHIQHQIFFTESKEGIKASDTIPPDSDSK